MDAKYENFLIDNLYIRAGVTVNYDNRPAVVGRETDYIFTTGLGWSWKAIPSNATKYIWGMLHNMFTYIRQNPKHREALFWIFAMAALAWQTPHPDTHYQLCVFSHLGFSFCPGCGIGRSIGYFLHADIAKSWQMHYFGIPATLILITRIITLLRPNKTKNG